MGNVRKCVKAQKILVPVWVAFICWCVEIILSLSFNGSRISFLGAKGRSDVCQRQTCVYKNASFRAYWLTAFT